MKTTVTIELKPAKLTNWVIIKETKKCLVLRKTFKERYGQKNYIGDCVYVPKKNIQSITTKAV